MTTPASKQKPFKADTLEPDIHESLRRVSLWPGARPDNEMDFKINGINAFHTRRQKAKRK